MGKLLRSSYDAIVIGGGHNGLVCAAYLAKKGKKVVVLEQRDTLGGACVTEMMDGCKVSRTSYVFSLFHPKIVRDLCLEDHGLELLMRDPPSFTPLKDGRYLILHQDTAKTQAEIAKFSARDAEAYPAYEAMLVRVGTFMESMLLRTPPDPNKYADLPTMLRMAYDARKLGDDLPTLIKLFSMSAYDFVTQYFESEPLISTLCTDGIIGTCGGPFTPNTAYVLLHHVMGESFGKRGVWAYVRGGMGGLTESIARSGMENGVDFVTGADVARIVIERGRAVGVELADGTVVKARVVASSADPNVTFRKLVAPADLPADFLGGISKIDYSSATSKINMVLNGELKFKSYDGPVPGTFHVCENAEYIERAYDDSKYGRVSDNLVLEGCVPSVVDETLAPHGKHVLSLLVQYTPYKLAGGWTDAARGDLVGRTLRKLDEYTNIMDVCKGSAVDVLTPVDLEREFRLTGGNLFHGSMPIHQLFHMRPLPGWAQYRTPVKGLYLAGSGTHPGGGVTGIPGHNAAREILKRL